MIILKVELSSTIFLNNQTAQSAGAIENANCIFAVM